MKALSTLVALSCALAASSVSCAGDGQPAPRTAPTGLTTGHQPAQPAEGEAPTSAQGDTTKEERAVATRIEDAYFLLRPADPERRTYRRGERIGLELVFWATKPKVYQLDAALYDRGGRLHIDTYHVEPADTAVDPLAVFYARGRFGMGGLRQMPMLDAEPTVVERELNEYIRFDAPGVYTLSVSTERLARDVEGDPPTQTLEARSNTITLEIVEPEPGWEDARIEEALVALARTDPASEDVRIDAARTLRFLQSPRATKELARRIAGSDDLGTHHNVTFGLFGSPHLALAIKTLEEAIEAPGAPVTSTWASTYETLRFMAAWPKPAPPWPQDDVAAQKRWRVEVEAPRQAFREKLRAEIQRRVDRARKSKTGEARLMSSYTALIAHPGPTGAAREALAADVIAGFAKLPVDSQRRLLGDAFLRVAKPSLVPGLEAFIDATDTPPDLRATALWRLHELDPRRGRARILDAISALAPDLGHSAMDALGALPEETLPSLDATLAANLEAKLKGGLYSDQALAARLVERYATAAVAPSLREIYTREAATFSQDVFAATTAYFLRVDPKVALAMLARVVMSDASSKARYSNLLLQIADLHFDPRLEALVTPWLEDEVDALVIGVAKMLQRHGSEAALRPLEKRHTRWSEANRSRAGELRYSVNNDEAISSAMQLEYALIESIIRGIGWLLADADLERLEGKCLTRPACQMVDSTRRTIASRPVFISASWPNYDRAPRLAIAQHHSGTFDLAQLEAKVRQYPAGTRFVISAHGGDDRAEAIAALQKKLEDMVTRCGMKIGEVSEFR